MRVVHSLVRTERTTIFRNVPWPVVGWKCLICGSQWEDRYWCNQSGYPHGHVHMVEEVCPFKYNKGKNLVDAIDLDLDF